jgi:hypothetical protein
VPWLLRVDAGDAATTELTPHAEPRLATRHAVTRTATWSRATLRLLVYSLLTFQVAQATWFRTSLFPFIRSYWVIGYDHGFVRRGLTGAALELVAGSPSVLTIEVAAFVVAVVALAALVVLVELLLRRGTSETAALAVLLACSPFTAEYVAFQRRPDLLAVPVVVGFGIALVRAPQRRHFWCAAAGLAFGALALAHEAVALQTVPWVLVLTVVILARDAHRHRRTDVREELRCLAWLSAPVAAVFLLVARFGLPGPGRAAAIRADAAHFHWQRGTTMLDVLGDSLGDSFARVRGLPHDGLTATVLFGLLLVVIHAVWLSKWANVSVVRVAWQARPHVVGIGSVLAVVIGTVAMFATGVDWLRWIAGSGLMWLLVSAIVSLAPTDSDGATSQPGAVLSRSVVPVAIYLALLFPLGEFLTPGGAVHRLLLGH